MQKKLIISLLLAAIFITSCKRAMLDDVEIEPRDPATPNFYHFMEDKTLEAGEHIIDGAYMIRGNITIKPGAVIIFTKRGQFIVERKGSIQAKGTAAQPVVFKGKDGDAFFPIRIEGVGTASMFEYCEFWKGGKTLLDINNQTSEAGCAVFMKGKAGFRNCLFKNSVKTALAFASHIIPAGFRTEYDGDITDWEANKITGSGEVPLRIPLRFTKAFDSLALSSYVGNAIDKILLLREDHLQIDASIGGSDVPYVFDINGTTLSDVLIQGNLTLRAGAQLEANSLKIYNGNLIARGTAAKPVKFKGKNYTNGIGLMEGTIGIVDNGSMDLDYIEIKDARLYLNIGLSTGAAQTMRVNHTTIDNPTGGGLYFVEFAPPTGPPITIDLDNITIKNTLNYAIYIPTGFDLGMGTNWTFSNNSKGIVGFGNNRTNFVFRNIGLPYDYRPSNINGSTTSGDFIINNNATPNGTILIEAGCEFIVSAAADLQAVVQGDNTTLTANGTAAKPIRFRVEGTTNNAYKGFIFNNVNGTMRYCQFEGFGRDYFGSAANVYLGSSNLSFQNCSFTRTTACGFNVSGSSSNPDGGGNTLTGGGNLICP